MTEWNSEKERNTAVQALKILSHTRTGKQQLVRYIQSIREDPDKDVDLYETDSKIQETINKIIEDDTFPVERSSEGNFFERTDQGVAY